MNFEGEEILIEINFHFKSHIIKNNKFTRPK